MFFLVENESGGKHLQLWTIVIPVSILIISLLITQNSSLSIIVLSLGIILVLFLCIVFGVYSAKNKNWVGLAGVVLSFLFVLGVYLASGFVLFGPSMEIVYPVNQSSIYTESSGIYSNVYANQVIWPYVKYENLYYFGHEPAIKNGGRSGIWVYRELVIGNSNSKGKTFRIGLAIVDNSTGQAEIFEKYLTDNHLDSKGVENPEQIYSAYGVRIYPNTEIEVTRI